MNYFHYPLDYDFLTKKRKRILRELKENSINPMKKRIAILGGSTTNEIASMLELFLMSNNIEVEIYQSEYNQYWQDAVFGNDILDNFEPDIVFVFTTFRNIERFPELSDSPEYVDELLDNEFNRFTEMWSSLSRKFQCPIIQNNFERPNYSLLGNRDIWDFHGKTNFILRLNQKFYEYAYSNKSFYINDIDGISAKIGLEKWHSSFYWNMYKYAMSFYAVPYVAKSAADIIKSLFGKNKKVLSLDLDNTLWGGVVGDDGVEGISIGKEVSEGQIYYEFQKYCKELQNLGVVLSVNSKNDEENALAGLNHPDGVLKPEDFVSIKANWNPKSENLIETASELNLGLDSMVFIDDNPAEQEIVRQHLPNVDVPYVESVDDFIKIIDDAGYFETTVLSNEDLDKTNIYKANVNREKLKSSFLDYNEYLKSLEMELTAESFDSIHFQRIAQLTNKSNQFNLTTLRCTEKDIEKMADSGEYITLYGSLSDKFGNNGVVSVVSGKRMDSKLHIILWLMSCRVLKRNVEQAMMNVLLDKCKEKKIKEVYGYYYPTAKNGMVKNFYEKMGFELVNSNENGDSIWKMTVSEYLPKTVCIEIL